VSVRLRLTLLYGGLFLLAGAALLGITMALVRANFSVPLTIRVENPNVAGGVFIVGPGVLPASRASQQAGPEEFTRQTVAVPGPEVLLAYRRQVEAAAMRQLMIRSGIALAVMAVLSIALGWVVAGRVLRPLTAITATAKRLSAGSLHERIALRGPPDELKALADTIDGMLARLDRAFSGQRRFVANASHELRTPLAITRTEVDVTLASRSATIEDYRAMAERVRDANERSERLIESLLVLASSERELRTPEPVDLSEAAAESLDAAKPEIDRRGLTLRHILDEAPVLGDRNLLERLVANLVENAVGHNADGGWIEVGTGRDGSRVKVSVANGGPVVPPEEVDSLFEPFRRLGGRTRSDRGVGLGLSIVRAVATAHGGTVHAEARQDGGLIVTVSLPAGEAGEAPRR
jgi:signal transduction histidine kinase